jgi:Vitamin K epoxide reductase family
MHLLYFIHGIPCFFLLFFLCASETFMRPQGKMASYFGLVPKGSALDLPNAAFGVVYYAYRLVLARNLSNTASAVLRAITMTLTTAAFVSTVWLAYQLTVVLGDLCVLCWSIHVINTTLFLQMIMTASSSSIPSKAKKNL